MMTHEELTKQGWIQTDGSCSTLQYAKKINETTWLYRQWLDKIIFDIEVHPMQQWRESFSCEYKLDNWDDDKWVEDKVDLMDYSEGDIAEALSTYGYKLNYYCLEAGGELFIIIEDGDYIYPVHDSIQLACECIFELEN